MTTTNMNLDLPVVGVTPEPLWATKLVDALEEIDGHDHNVSGKKLTQASIDVTDTWSFNANKIENVLLTKFTSQTNDLTERRGLYSKGDDLYFVDGVGTNIRLTSGGTIAVSGLGGISGLNGTTAAVTYSNLNKEFTFTRDSGVTAKVLCGDLRLKSATGNNGVTLKPLTGTDEYTWTLPPTLGINGQIISLGTSGELWNRSLFGTSNQVIVTTSGIGYTLSLPQDINTNSVVTFNTVNAINTSFGDNYANSFLVSTGSGPNNTSIASCVIAANRVNNFVMCYVNMRISRTSLGINGTADISLPIARSITGNFSSTRQLYGAVGCRDLFEDAGDSTWQVNYIKSIAGEQKVRILIRTLGGTSATGDVNLQFQFGYFI